MIFNNAIIIDKSEIIREGLSGILKRTGLVQKIIELDTPDKFSKNLPQEGADLILLNPEFYSDKLDYQGLRYFIPEKTKVFAIVYSHFDESILSNYHGTISVFDNEQRIQGKLKDMCVSCNCKKCTHPCKLSTREEEVLKYLVKGYSNKEVANSLCISAHTVISHRKNITEKTGIKSLSGLTVYALSKQLLNMDEIIL